MGARFGCFGAPLFDHPSMRERILKTSTQNSSPPTRLRFKILLGKPLRTDSHRVSHSPTLFEKKTKIESTTGILTQTITLGPSLTPRGRQNDKQIIRFLMGSRIAFFWFRKFLFCSKILPPILVPTFGGRSGRPNCRYQGGTGSRQKRRRVEQRSLRRPFKHRFPRAGEHFGAHVRDNRTA